MIFLEDISLSRERALQLNCSDPLPKIRLFLDEMAKRGWILTLKDPSEWAPAQIEEFLKTYLEVK